ncbi:hypothetical protein ES703_84011 [subsurface metagenome]
MDTTVTPPFAVWQILRDGLPKAVTLQGWLSPTVFLLEYSGTGPVSTGIVNLLTEDIGLRCYTGSLASAPQSVQFFP